MVGLREEELAYQRAQITQGKLYEGMYDSSRRDSSIGGAVQLLNPCYGEDDPTARRFSLLEVD